MSRENIIDVFVAQFDVVPCEKDATKCQLVFFVAEQPGKGQRESTWLSQRKHMVGAVR